MRIFHTIVISLWLFKSLFTYYVLYKVHLAVKLRVFVSVKILIHQSQYPQKFMASTLIMQLAERDGDGNNNKVYVKIINNFYVILHSKRI